MDRGRAASSIVLSLSAILFCLGTVWGFNVDLKSAKSFSVGTSQGDYFGYSVTLHNNDIGGWLLVGAPLSSEGGTAKEKRPGNLYKCPLSTSGSCTRIPIDSQKQYDDRSLQWLGSNVYSSGPNINIVTCAPRFKDLDSGNIWLHGRCAILNGKSFAVRKLINPCKSQRLQGNIYYGYCQAGMSATLAGSGASLLMGLPGYSQTTGKLGIVDIKNLGPSSTNAFTTTTVDRLAHGDSMGFSVAWGNFSGNKFGDIVGGAPSSSELKGKVILYTNVSPLRVTGVLENPEGQTGSSYGSTICVLDVNNDGHSDILVGAPLYSVRYEEGKVYLYLNNGLGALTLILPHIASEKRPGARFGSSIASLGDINKDGYRDIIIGAPFGGTNGKGAVYLYHGAAQGLKNGFKPIQVIQASDLPGNPVAFGISVAGGVDIDKNGYPDIAIGSYISEKAHVLRSKPVLKMVGRITFNSSKIPVSTNRSQCIGPDKKPYVCIKMDACLKFGGESVPNNINTNVTLSLDGGQVGEKRVFLFKGTTRESKRALNMALTKDTEKCESFVVYAAANNVKDLLSPINVVMEYAYVTPASCGAALCPVMDPSAGNSVTSQLLYLKGCGNDDICNTFLVLKASYALPPGQKELVFGVVSTFIITATVENKKENAFLAVLHIEIPTDLESVSAETSEGVALYWDLDKKTNKMSINLGSPFAAGKKVTIRAKFDPRERPTIRKQKFTLTTTTISKDENQKNNKVELEVNAAFLADFTVKGSARPDNLVYSPDPAKSKDEVKKVTDVGPEVKYTFDITNKGPAPVEKLKVRVSITSMEKSSYLLYLISATIQGTSGCKVIANPVNLTADTVPSKNETRPNRRRRSVDRLDCRTAICTSFDCQIGRLVRGEERRLKLTTRVWEHTLKKRGNNPVDLIVKAVLEVPKEELTFLRQPSNHAADQAEVVIRVSAPAAKSSTKDTIAWWIILVAVLAGLLLLAIPTAIMYKQGFFKRDRRIKEITGPSGGAEDIE